MNQKIKSYGNWMLMKTLSHPNLGRNFLSLPKQHLSGTGGNVLIYVVVLMLIFGTLSVAMVSLFTSSTASTTTRNDTRRSRYLSEAGVRYAIGELHQADFEEDIIIDPLNTLTYTVSGAGSFDINILSPWFDSNVSVDSPADISLNVPLGELPDDFNVPNGPGVWVVNYDYITGTGPDITTMRDRVISYTKDDDTNLTIGLTGDFVVNQDERVCLAVEPTEDRAITEGVDLYVARDARLFFPPFNGAISINRVDYAYARLVDDPANNRVILENVTASQFPNTLSADQTVRAGTGASPYDGHFVILSPRNYMVMAEGTSDEVTYGNSYLQGMSAYDHSLIQEDSRKPDITAEDLVTSLSEKETDTRFFETNLVDYELEIGGGTTDEFGSAFFDASMNIGGERDYCQQGACLFNLGVRVFFLLDFNQQGDGITFTLTSFGPELAPHNSASSVGGDIQLSELMGYAGDSRIVPNADPLIDSDFLATNPNDRGLDPPKIAVEFDTQTNNEALPYCADPVNANSNTRNDPRFDPPPTLRDAVQYVFWGNETLNILCRDNNPSYDDNRHDTGGRIFPPWSFATGGLVVSSPAIGADGTIYVGSDDFKVYAINPDGSPKPAPWPFATGGAVRSSPAIGSDGTIYVGSNDSNLYAINPNGTQKWRFTAGGAVWSSPAIGSDGTIYVGSDDGFLYAINPDGLPKPAPWPFAAGAEVRSSPAIDLTSGPHNGTIYVGVGDPAISDDGKLFAINPDGTQKWVFLPDGVGDDDVDSSPAIGSDGTIYVGSDDNSLYAINPTDGSKIWRFNTIYNVESKPAISESTNTVYVESESTRLYAVNIANGLQRWEFNLGVSFDDGEVDSSPVIGDIGNVYVGSRDGNVYAVNPVDRSAGRPFPTENEWAFPTGNEVRSSPAIGSDGAVYVGSNDFNVYAINPNDTPRNIKNLFLTSEQLDSTVSVDSEMDWLNGDISKGSYAVRLEVDRSQVGRLNGAGELVFDYELRLWMRQCSDPGDFPCDEILGTFYQDTRIEYDYSAVPATLPMIQRFSLSALDQAKFDRFYFGFTGAAGAEALNATISRFQLSFIRPGDLVVTDDSTNWPP